MACGPKCSKALLVAFNFFFWISGCVLLAIGVWILVDPSKKYLFELIASNTGTSEVLEYLSYALCALGGFVVLVGFFGCCGAMQESKCMLVTYFLCLFLILCAELTVGIFCFIYRGVLLDDLNMHLKDQLVQKYRTRPSDDHQTLFTTSIDFAQYKFQCCGMNNASDYENSIWMNTTAKQTLEAIRVPKTCCALLDTKSPDPWVNPKPRNNTRCQSGKQSEYEGARYQEGCYHKLVAWFEQETLILILIAIGVGGMEVFGMIFSICLCRSIGEEP